MATSPLKSVSQNRSADDIASALHLFTSSEARRDWKNVTERALAGDKVAILIGKRALALHPVELTYAAEEYGVGEIELHDKAQEVLKRARKERAEGKTGAACKLL